MTNEEQAADGRVAEDHAQNLPQPLAGSVQLVGQHLEKCDVEERSAGNTYKHYQNSLHVETIARMVVTLKNSVPAVTGEAGWEAGHADPDGDPKGAGEGEH